MVDFTAEWVNFEMKGWGFYERYIEKLRNLIAVRYSHNSPVAPLVVEPPTQFFDVELGTNHHNITLRFRRDNLYLIGYRIQGSEQWFELLYDSRNQHNQSPGPGDPPRGYNPVHRIPGAQWLSFGERYGQLRGATVGPETAAPALTSPTFNFGRDNFIDAINALATTTDDKIKAKSLIVLAIMISESLRFKKISSYFSSFGSTRARLPEWIDRYIHGWANLSYAILIRDLVDELGNLFEPRAIPGNFPTIETILQAVAIIGVMMHGSDLPWRPKRAADDNNLNIGRPLVELFSVTIDNIHGNQNIIGDIYGTIKVSDGLGYEYMYNRKTNDSESIRMRDTILLNGPPRCLSAYDNFTIDVALMSREGLSTDDEISKGQIDREVTYLDTTDYDKLLTQQIKGRFGSATLSYAILRDAVVATVEVTLIKNNGEPADVYGLLTSHNVALNSESVLFRKANNRFVNVEPGTSIPLSRSVVAAHLRSDFIVRADLKGANIFSSDDEIAKVMDTKLSNTIIKEKQEIWRRNREFNEKIEDILGKLGVRKRG